MHKKIISMIAPHLDNVSMTVIYLFDICPSGS